MSDNCNLAYFALQRWRYSTRVVTNKIKSTYASGKQLKKLRYSNRAVTNVVNYSNTAVIHAQSWRYTRKTFYEYKNS